MAITINAAGTYTVETRATGANCDSTTGWAAVKLEGGGGAPTAIQSVGSTDLVVEGTNAIETTTNKQRVLLVHTPGGSFDFTSGSTGSGTTKVPNGLFWIWGIFLASGTMFTEANGGFQIMLGDGTNRAFWNVAGSDTYLGGFRKWAIAVDLATRFTTDDVGTVQIGNITEFGMVTDVGTATTRFANFVVDAYDIGDGLTFTGSTVSGKLFEEAFNAQDTTKIGILANENGIIFSQGNIEFDGTGQVSSGETLIFTDTILDSTYVYDCNFTGTHTLTNSNINASGGVKYNLDFTGSTTTKSGGVFTNFNTLTIPAGQTFSGGVYQSGGSGTIASAISGETFNSCGTQTVSAIITGCTFNEASADAVSTSDTANLANCSFVKGAGNFNAVQLTGGAATYTWTSSLSGYDSGTAGGEGVDVAVKGGSITGNEAIHITATSGTFRISVTAGDTPSVSSAGAVVYVIAGQKTFTQTISPVPTPNYEYRLYYVTAEGSMSGATEITAEGEEFATSGTHSYTHTETNQPVAVQILSDAYVEKISYFTLTAADLSVTINLDIDNND